MATVYSLLCFGGLNGNTVTFTDAGDIVNLANHGLRTGKAIVFNDNGNTLPAGLTKGTPPYYVRSTGTGTFTLYPSAADAVAGTNQITFTGTGTGTHKVMSAYRYGLASLSRWGGTRIYESLPAWNTARSGTGVASPFDTEVCEIGDDWDDLIPASGYLSITVPAASSIITTVVNGARSAGFHNGTLGAGYAFGIYSAGNINIISLGKYRTILDGFTVKSGGSTYAPSGISMYGGPMCAAKNMIVLGRNDGTGAGITINSALSYASNCIVAGWAQGFYVPNYTIGLGIYNCLAVKNTTGFYVSSPASTQGFYYNNIAIGNTTNWGTIPGQVEGAANNAGLSGEAWGASSRIVIATSDFTAWGGAGWASTDNYRPAAASSPQVEAGISYYGIALSDLADGVRPNYFDTTGGAAVTAGAFVVGTAYVIASIGTTDFTLIGATANTVGLQFRASGVGSGTGTATPIDAFDVGCFEYNHGMGLKPENLLTISNLVAGSTVRIFTTGTQTEQASTTNSGTSFAPTGLSGTVDVTILQDGYIPIRLTGIALASGTNLPLDGTQTLDRAYQASSGLTYGTTATVNTSTKQFALTTATTGQNWYSFWVEQYRQHVDLRNKPFPLQANGPNSFTLKQGYEFASGASLAYISRDGIRYTDTAGTMTASWAALLSVGVPAGLQVRYQQVNGAAPTNAVATGNIDQLIQIYGDATHGNFDRRGYLVCKVQAQGYDQAEVDVVAQYGNLEDQLFVIALVPTANGLATGNPALANPPTITDHGATPVTWNGKVFSVTITDSAAGNTGTDIARWIRYAEATGGTFQGTDAFNRHDLTQTNGTKFKGVRGAVHGGTGAALKGVRVVRSDGTSAHLDFDLFTADDGTTYSPPTLTYQQVVLTGLVANSRVQIYDTTAASELYNGVVAGTSYTWTDTALPVANRSIRLRVSYVSGATAKTFIDTNIGTCGTSAGNAVVSYLVSQSDNAVYNANLIDGSLITDCSITGTSLHVDINAGSTTWQHIYAWMTYWLYTSGGIRDQYLEMVATDQTHYTFLTAHGSFKVKNVTAPSVPLLITGGNAQPDVGAVTDILDTTGGTIFCIEGTVVPFVTGSGVTAQDKVDIAIAARTEIDAHSTKLDVPVSSRLNVGQLIALG